jgi:hypothetical protein
VAERFGDDADVHAEVDALPTIGVAQLVRGESHTQVALRPPARDTDESNIPLSA